MKSPALFLGLLFTMTCQSLLAFDPVGPPPSTSIALTTRFVSNVKLARVDMPDEDLEAVLQFIRVMEIPEKAGVVIDASKMNLPENTRVRIVEKDITILAAVGIIAEQINADVLIQPGKIYLVPKLEMRIPTK
ncbi:MAG: hypothetical protein EOP88_16080 [Verrucomicrobiaceae bacterium]|nr:MAG: hypothetical protein EOP88_16080 [Verrucomicrobiaceae bacterium]